MSERKIKTNVVYPITFGTNSFVMTWDQETDKFSLSWRDKPFWGRDTIEKRRVAEGLRELADKIEEVEIHIENIRTVAMPRTPKVEVEREAGTEDPTDEK